MSTYGATAYPDVIEPGMEVGTGVGVEIVGVGEAVGVGAWLDAVVLNVKPNAVLAPGASAPFHEALCAIRWPAVDALTAFQVEVTVPSIGTSTFHSVTGVVPVFVTVASTVDPLSQELVVRSSTRNAPDGLLCVGEGVGVELGVGAGGVVGVGSGDGVVVLVIRHANPTTVHEVGTRAPGVNEVAMRPNEADAPGAREGFQAGAPKAAEPACWDQVVSHAEVT